MLKEGAKAPELNLKDKDGATYKLKDLSSDYTLIFFYPKDNTPGCTTEALQFTKDLAKFNKLNTQIVGISGGDEKSKTKFCEKHNLKILLLSDPDFKVSTKFGVYGERSFMGKKYMGIGRHSFLLNKEKKIVKVYEKVKPKEHSNEVIKDIKELQDS